jgi:hypothetical protein
MLQEVQNYSTQLQAKAKSGKEDKQLLKGLNNFSWPKADKLI